MMAIPVIQHIQNEYASTPVESYSYYNEMVRFVGSDTFIGFDGNLFPVSWNVFEANPNYSPGPQVNPFAVSTNNTNTSAPLIEETFSHYTTKRIESVWQNSAVMIKWNHYVKIAEIFSFTNSGIDASIVVKNLNVTNTYISTFSLGMGINSTMAVNGFNPSCQNISSGTGIIPSNDWNVSVGNISVNWQSEDSIFHSGIVSESQSGDQIILPFETGIINHNQSYTIDPMIYYSPYRIIGWPGPRIGPGPSPGPTPAPQRYSVIFTESGLSSGISWHVTLNGNTQYSTSNTITFSEYDGSYSYTIGSVSGYTDSPSSGYVYVSGGSRSISIAYATQSYTLTFTESGLSSGTSWTIDLNGNTISTTSSSISFPEPDGSYSYSIGSISGYGLSPSSGTANINGGSTTVSVTYTEMIGNFCPTYNYGCYNMKGTLNSYNLTQAINKAYNSTSPGGVSTNYVMLPGELSNIAFNIPYFDANMVHNLPTCYSYGMFVYTLTPSGDIGKLIYANSNLFGNGIAHVSWQTQPGAYGGFMVKMINNAGSASEYYKHPFDVYSRLVNNAYGPCFGDSVASTSIYSSSGIYIGNLVITASNGPSGHKCYYDRNIPFGLTTVFYSPDNNVSLNQYKYGVLNYNQYLNFTGPQIGSASGYPIYEPECALNQGTSSSDTATNQTTIEAEHSLYDLTDNVLLLTADPCLMAVGLAMVALGPFVFPGSAPSNKQSYWNSKFGMVNSISYGSWDLGKRGSNLPSPYFKVVGYRTGPFSQPVGREVYQIVNNGNGNPSYMQYLNMILYQQPKNSLTIHSSRYILNYYTYSVSMTIVPITHYICGFHLNQNDYVNATWHSTSWFSGHFVYNGASYTVAVSLQLYIPLEG
ncbi:MAG: hypothetical protein AAE985_03285 [Thermoplasmataceae archaeon]|jgi:hypothetical protein